ncbi:MAG: MFS transporter [Planctomycetota bacterium]
MTFNPFAGLAKPREVFAWGLYDLANQSFTLIIITLLFSLYVQQVVTPRPVLTDAEVALIDAVESGETAATPEYDALCVQIETADNQGRWNWSLMHGGSLLIVVVLSPLAGAIGDARGWRKQFLMGAGVGCALLTCGLGFVGPEMVLLAALIYIPANVCYQVGENFLASFLPDVSTPQTLGRVSATGWTMGYIGALILLVFSLAFMLAFGWDDPAEWRPFFVLSGLWFLLGIIPTQLVLKSDDPLPNAKSAGLIDQSFGRLFETARHAGEYREVVKFLTAFLVYGFGVQVIVGFASIIARGFGFADTDLVIFVAQITIMAGLAAALTARFQDRYGARATVLFYLVVWLASSAALVAIKLIWPTGGPQWPLWVVGNGLGVGLGGIGTASRSLLAKFAPHHRRAEFFGLWGMTYKLAAAVGVLSFGAVSRVFGEVASLVLLTSFFAVGFVLMLRVNEVAGMCAARRVERREHSVDRRSAVLASGDVHPGDAATGAGLPTDAESI